jgi:orotate phosphoribosyltransferase
MNEATRQLRKKGYTVNEFLLVINRKLTWWNTHKHLTGKDNDLLMLSIKGLEEK